MDEFYKKLFAGLVAEGDEDIIGFWEITCRLERHLEIKRQSITTEQNTELLRSTLIVITMMLQNGFAIIDPVEPHHGKPQVDQTPSTVCQRIAEAWKQADNGRTSELGFVYWFEKKTRLDAIEAQDSV